MDKVLAGPLIQYTKDELIIELKRLRVVCNDEVNKVVNLGIMLRTIKMELKVLTERIEKWQI